MISERMSTLLTASAVMLRKGEPPLSHGFLVEHGVTLDEAYDLAEWLAAACETVLELDRTAEGRRLIGLAIGHAAFSDGRWKL